MSRGELLIQLTKILIGLAILIEGYLLFNKI